MKSLNERAINKIVCAMAENRTRVECLEGTHANHYTTIAVTHGI